MCADGFGIARPDWHPRSLLDLGAGPGVAAWAAAEAWPSLEQRHARRGRARDGRGWTRARWLRRRRRSVRLAGSSGRCGGPSRRGGARDRRRTARRARAAGDSRPLSGARGRVRRDTLRRRRARHDRRLRASAPRPGRRDRRRRHGARPVPARRHVPAPGRRLVPLLRPPRPQPFAPRRPRVASGVRGREALATWSLCRSPAAAADRRGCIRRPDLRGGHVVLDLCTAEGLERRTVSRRDGADYKQARKLGWGDALRERRL